eukprot:scaffold10922_cov42-Cyclotella_meneghiniana.AAC.2
MSGVASVETKEISHLQRIIKNQIWRNRGIFRTPHKISRRMILFRPEPLQLAEVILGPLSFGALTILAITMAASPPRPPLGSIPINQTPVTSPKRSNVAVHGNAAARAAESSALSRYHQPRFIPYSPPSPMKTLMTNVSKFRWNVPELRDRQRYSLCFIFVSAREAGEDAETV